MVSGKSFTKEFIFSKFTNKSEIIEKSTENSCVVGGASDDKEQQMTNINLMVRRGSKSLPASPNSMRKFQPNPYFTSTNSNSNSSSSSSSSSSDTNRSNWFLAGILGYNQRDQTTSITSIAPSTSSPSLAKSTASDDNNLYKSTSNPKILKAKPSELREMNFWSPTSM